MAKCNQDCFHCVFTDCILGDDEEFLTRYEKFSPEEKESYKKRCRDNGKVRYQKLKSEGVCVRCGVREAKYGVLCHRCYVKGRVRYESKKSSFSVYEDRKMRGVCAYCGEPVFDGFRVCRRHYELKVKAAEKAHGKMKQEGRDRFYMDAFWKKILRHG